jgi:hypothetical protein
MDDKTSLVRRTAILAGSCFFIGLVAVVWILTANPTVAFVSGGVAGPLISLWVYKRTTVQLRARQSSRDS